MLRRMPVLKGMTTVSQTKVSQGSVCSTAFAATTPWIAFITCDYDPNFPSNTTDDTFTLAKNRGAVAIVSPLVVW